MYVCVCGVHKKEKRERERDRKREREGKEKRGRGRKKMIPKDKWTIVSLFIDKEKLAMKVSIKLSLIKKDFN